MCQEICIYSKTPGFKLTWEIRDSKYIMFWQNKLDDLNLRFCLKEDVLFVF